MVKNDNINCAIHGMITNEWEISTIAEYIKIETGTKNTEDKISNGKYPFYVRSQNVERIDYYCYDTEAVITAGDGVGTGKIFHYINGKFNAHQRVYVMTNFGKIIGRFFYYFFSYYFYNEVAKYTAKSSVDSVRRDMIANMLIPIPSLEEQRAIVEALTDIDNVIFFLEKLYEKKKAIKQGAMQELLTGRKRLNGFTGDWKKLKLKDILSIGHGQNQKKIEKKNGKYKILATGGCIGYTDEFLWNRPSVLIGRKGTIDKPQYVDEPFWTIDTLFYTKIKDGFNARCLFYYLQMIDWMNYNEASGVPSLSAKIIEKIEIDIPEYNEQCEIAKMIDSMDFEIASLELKLLKYRQIKQGMMQELLTGRIRLI